MTNGGRLRRLGLAGLMVFAGAGTAAVRSQNATPQFRAGVDLVPVEVQVVDSNGAPVAGIPASSFDVRIDGRRRRVTSADFVREMSTSGSTVRASPIDGPTARNIWPASGAGAGRTFVLAFDESTLSSGDGARAINAGREFIDRLASNDAVGVVGLPHGIVLSPTRDRRTVSAALSRVGGHQSMRANKFQLSASEVVDIAVDVEQAENATLSAGRASAGRGIVVAPQSVLQHVQTRECRSTTDSMCLAQLMIEAESQARDMEERVFETFSGLTRLLRVLAESPGRKTVVLMSGGMPSGDRWLQDGGAIRDLGRAAALASSTVYAIHFDTGYASIFTAESRTSRPSFSRGRERDIQQRLLADFAETSGGALFSAPTDSGQSGLARVLLETSGVYVLGVVPTPRDLDGKPHELKVNISQKGVTLRNLRYVVLRRN
jgi:VWFA-related protein